jgi:hypothetical protein
MFSLSTDLVPSSLSADGNTLLIGPSEDKLAFDLRTRKTISIGSGLKGGINGPYAFLGNDKIVGVSRPNAKDSGIFSFPDGKRLQSIPFTQTDLESVTNGDYVLSRGVKDYAIGLAQVSDGNYVLASKARSMDVFNGALLNENADGSVVLHKIGDKTVPDQSTTLPLSPLGQSLYGSISQDRRYLALSTRTRGGVWDLATGERVLLTRRFIGASFAPDDTAYIDFPKEEKQERSIVHFQFAPFSATPVAYKVDATMRVGDGTLREWKHMDNKAVELIVHDLRDDSVLWRQSFDIMPANTSNLNPGEMLFAYRLKSDFAKERLDANPKLAAQAAAVSNPNAAGIIQVVDDHTGKLLHEVALEVPLDYEGLQGIHVIGDELYLAGLNNRTIVYDLATGKQNRQVFGTVVAADASSGRVCTVNRRDEAIVYDAAGQELAHFNLGSMLRLAAFKNSAQGHADQLVLFTADQKVRTMAIPNAAHAQMVAP